MSNKAIKISLEVIVLSLLCVILYIINVKKPFTIQQKEVQIILKDTVFVKDTVYVSYESTLQDKPNIPELREALKHYGIKHPDVVLAQAILETGWFESNICKKKNNIFGLFNNRKMDFFKFKHWGLSVKGYKDLFQYKYKPPDNATDEDYYRFLKKAGYAEDPNYINKVRKITNQLISKYGKI